MPPDDVKRLNPFNMSKPQDFATRYNKMYESVTRLRNELARSNRHGEKTYLDEQQRAFENKITQLAFDRNVDLLALNFKDDAAIRVNLLMAAWEREFSEFEKRVRGETERLHVFEAEGAWRDEARTLGAVGCLQAIEQSIARPLRIVIAEDGVKELVASDVALNPKLELMLQMHRAEIVRILRERGQPKLY